MRKFFILLFFTLGIAWTSSAQDPPTVSGETVICAGSTTTLTASGESGAVYSWYDVASGGSAISTGANFTSPVLSSNIDYYVDQTTGAGTSGRTQVTVIVTPIPSPNLPTNVTATATEICTGESTSLSASVDASNYQIVNWYDASTGGNLLGTTDSGQAFVVTPTDTTTYFAQSELQINSQIFNYTGSAQTFTVPAGVYSIEVDAYGAKGGLGNYKAGGNGGRVEATMSVNPGDVLHLYVGGAGQGYGSPYSGGRTGGWNGGGNTYSYKAGAGGGATDIRIGGTALTDRVLVAGAGGGSGGSNCSSGSFIGGHGGGLTGGHGGGCNGYSSSRRGAGGTQAAGGARGCRFSNSYCGTNGSLGQGGNGNTSDGGHYGGAGGGGYYGGGGGSSNSDGGGGSSYTDPTLFSSVIHTQGVRNGHGQIVITYSAGASCASTTRVPVTVNVNTVPTVTVSNDTAICNGNSVSLFASGADTYTWSPGGETTSSILVSPNSTTTYSVTGTLSAGGCTNQADVTVTISQVVASNDVTICEGQSTTLSATGSNTYTWEPGSLTGASVSVSPTTTTEYIVTGTEVNGCSTSDTVIVTVNSIPVLSTSADTIIEHGSSADLSVNGADTYAWTPGGATSSSVSVSPTVNTTYTVTGTYTSTGCNSSESIIVTVIDPMVVSGAKSLCEGDATSLTVSGYNTATFAWYDAPTGGTILSSSGTYTTPALLTTTNYYVEQSFGSYTSERDLVTVFVTPLDQPVNLAANADSICVGEQSDLTADVMASSYRKVFWYDSLTGGNLLAIRDSGETFSVSPISTTTYYAQSDFETTTQTFNYTGSVQTFVVPNGVTSINVDAYGGKGGLGNYKAGGNGGQVQATLSVTPGETLHIYVGGQGQGYGSPYSGGRTGGWNGGGNSYSYKAGAGGGATDIRIGGTALTDRVLVAGAGGGSGGSNCSSGSYTGGHGGGLTGGHGGGCNGYSASRRGAGGTQTAGGARGCRFGNSYCGANGSLGQGGNGTPSDGGHYGGAGGGGYYGGGGGSSNADGGGGSSYTHPSLCTNVTHTQGVRNGHGLLTITYTQAPPVSCLQARVPVTVTVLTPPVLNPTNDTTICKGMTLILEAGGNDTYTWMPGTGNFVGPTLSVTPSATSTYSVEATNGVCTLTDDVTVTVNDISTSGDIAICEGDNTTLTASGMDTYSWQPGGETTNSISVNPVTDTDYIVTGSLISGCSLLDTIHVTVYPYPTISVSSDTSINSGESLTLSASGTDNYTWTPGGATTASITISPTTSTTYTVTGTSNNPAACATSENVQVTVFNDLSASGNKEVCQGNGTTLTAVGTTGASFAWYDTPSGGSLLGSGSTYSTGPLTNTTTIYLEQTVNGYTDDREAIVVQVILPFVATNLSADVTAICVGGESELQADVDASAFQKVFWYDALTGGNLLGVVDSGEAFAVTPTITTTYYAQSETEEFTLTYNYTGAVQTFVVPAGVTNIDVNAYGGRGGWGNYKAGGNGGQVQAAISVTPGDTLHLYVGGQGQGYGSPYSGGRTGGWNGGGNSYSYKAGAGGGATDIRIGGTALTDRILVAGAGAGSGGSNCSSGSYTGGHGGGLTGGHGGGCNGYSSSRRGAGGTQTAGGARGCRFGNSYCGSNGSLGQGGNGTPSDGGHYGGAGGGGYYGGGGGSSNADGGGGSSYTHPSLCSNVTHTQGVRNGHGQLIITYSAGPSIVCPATRDSITIDVSSMPANMTVSSDTTILQNSIAMLTASGVDSVSWMGGVATGDTFEFIAAMDTGVIVIGYDLTTACMATDTIQVSTEVMPSVSGTTIVLRGDSTTLVANAPSSILSDDGEVMALFEPLSSITYTWYDAATGGNILGTGETYTTVVLDTNTTFFVDMDDGSGVSLRKCIQVNVVDPESTTVTTEQDTICPSGNTNLTGELENPGTINWYDTPSGGTLLATTQRGETLNVTPSSTTTYYGQGATIEVSDTFEFTGALQTFTVPQGVTSILVDAYGAAGANGVAIGQERGFGGRLQASINVTPGQELNLYVGGQATGTNGGWNGGGDADGSAGAGGGASDIRINGTALINRILVAGAGGGGSSFNACDGNGGIGGGLTGGAGGSVCPDIDAGQGGTQLAGGTGGIYRNAPDTFYAENGAFGLGGTGYTTLGGGGGAGWYGGGGGSFNGTGGGGGSSFAHAELCNSISHTQGVRDGNGVIYITYSMNSTGVNFDSVTVDVGDYIAPVPDVSTLDTITADGSVTLTAPTGTDDCLGAMTATTTDPTTYNSPGIYEVNWEYEDAQGNLVAQPQIVVVNAVLPVELIYFGARKGEGAVNLLWTTANELNSKGFGIQRSSDARNWEEIGFVLSHQNSSLENSYQFVDKNPREGVNYYRLLLLDLDESYSYSDIVQAEFTSALTGISVFPNPTSSGSFSVELQGKKWEANQTSLMVFDQLGRKVIDRTVTERIIELDISKLPAGTYTVNVVSGSSRYQARVVVIQE